jgi:acetoacetyl-CoA synthetase
MPSMPVGFWNDPGGNRYRASYFDRFPGVWRHGDWVTFTDRGSCVISGRSDATLNRGGVRVGTAEIYRVVEAVDGVDDSLIVHLEDPAGGAGELVLLVATQQWSAELVGAIRAALRAQLSPRHVPDEVLQVSSIPTTLSGKKLELPVKHILQGAAPDDVASRGALRVPAALDEVAALAITRKSGSS